MAVMNWQGPIFVLFMGFHEGFNGFIHLTGMEGIIVMRNTTPRSPIEKRSDLELLEDLCIALRNVGVRESNLPDGSRVKQDISEVCAIHQELTRRGVDSSSRLSKLLARQAQPELLCSGPCSFSLCLYPVTAPLSSNDMPNSQVPHLVRKLHRLMSALA